jgi:hypothetical protein
MTLCEMLSLEGRDGEVLGLLVRALYRLREGGGGGGRGRQEVCYMQAIKAIKALLRLYSGSIKSFHRRAKQVPVASVATP